MIQKRNDQEELMCHDGDTKRCILIWDYCASHEAVSGLYRLNGCDHR